MVSHISSARATEPAGYRVGRDGIESSRCDNTAPGAVNHFQVWLLLANSFLFDVSCYFWPGAQSGPRTVL